MREKSKISLGPGAASLILIFVVLSLASLGMLALMSANSDLKLSERSARVAEAVYALQEQAEAHRADIDTLLLRCAEDAEDDEAYLSAVEEVLPGELSLDGRELSWLEEDGIRVLDCALELQPLGEQPRTVWVRHDLMTETGDTWEDAWN